MINIYIGSSSNGEDGEIETVLEYTLRNNTNESLNIIWMRQPRDPKSYWYGFTTDRWSTPFSGFRWAIPEHQNFNGRAIYMDVDQINFRDISHLYNIDLNGKPFAARKGTRFGGHEFCVMVIDCERAKDFLIPVERQRTLVDYHHRCIGAFSGNDDLVQELDPRWNCLDGEGLAPEEIWHLHWTNMATQPWTPSWYVGETKEHPRQDLVEIYHKLVGDAMKAGYLWKFPEETQVRYRIIGR